jgi:lipopolysaccharide/colanic/teichoic acid biosynthesis glycosyltransferase
VVTAQEELIFLTTRDTQRSRRPCEFVKRSIDIAIASVGLLLTAPLLLLLAVAVRLDSPGPAFFHQIRVGRYGDPFTILKFRTMGEKADEGVHERHLKRPLDPSNARTLAIRLDNDPRITRTGRFLRRWSLDELPNLWNVLKGDMSMVGPRPLVPYEVEALEGTSLSRLNVRPGVTGLAQVNGRLDASLQQRTDYDVEYAESCSIPRDSSILVKTVPTLLNRKGI